MCLKIGYTDYKNLPTQEIIMKNKYILPSFLLCSFASQTTLAETQAELVKDIWQGSESSVSTSPIITINNKAFFFANDNEHGKELWQSDGTATGTKLFKDILPGPDSSNPIAMTLVGENIFLITEASPHGLIKIDSTTGESIVLVTSNEGAVDTIGHSEPSPFANLTNIDGTLFFSLYSSEQNGYQPWESDGTIEGTKQVSSISFNSPIKHWSIQNNNVIFGEGNKLWFSTRSNLAAIKINGEFNYLDSQLVKMNNATYFISDSQTQSAATLRKYDGSEISLVKLMEPNAYFASKLINVNGSLFFTLRHFENKTTSLWKSDGTADGTVLLKKIPNNHPDGFFKSLTHLNSTIFFTSSNELWKSDGTADGTVLVQSFPIGDPNLPRNPYLFEANDAIFLSLSDSGSNEIRKVDEAGIAEEYVLPEETMISFSPVSYFIFTINNGLFSFLDNETYGKELFQLNNNPTVETTPPTCATGLDPQTIQAGEGTALWWWSQNATTGSINNGIGNVTVPSDYKWIHPAETTTYTLTAKGTNGATTSCETTLIVEDNTATPPVCEMGADPQMITAGEGTALWWWSQNVSSATINNEKWSVSVPSDYTWFYPSETATYTMTAIGDDGETASCKTTIEVTQ